MVPMRTHDLSMKIIDRKLHVLLTMEFFRKTVIIYATQQKVTQKIQEIIRSKNFIEIVESMPF